MKKIYLIDNNIIYLSSLEAGLRALNHRVIANDSAHGHEHIFKDVLISQPDFIVMDFVFPLFKGKDLLHNFAENEHTNNIPVIVYTNSSNKRHVTDIESKGVKHIIYKEDFLPNRLIERLKKVYNF